MRKETIELRRETIRLRKLTNAEEVYNLNNEDKADEEHGFDQMMNIHRVQTGNDPIPL